MLLNATVMNVPLWASIPFVIMLLMIAISPLVIENWWERNRNKLVVTALLSMPVAYYLIDAGLVHELEHQIFGDYLPFIILLTALFVITGGIHLSGDIKAKPIVNTMFLAIGFVLASFMGTTGAAMLLIRPLIETNSQRKYKVHTILFFIATVANSGGLLTPLGDPPLLLLYLRGASFTWFFNLIPMWAMVGAILLALYFFIDSHYYKKEEWTALSADSREVRPLRIYGSINLIFLAGVVAAVAFINSDMLPAMADPEAPWWIKFFRELILAGFIIMSLLNTPKEVRDMNKYSWRPIIEVAVVFLGIFITMTPTIMYLNQNASLLGLTEPWHFYYMTGALSSFLDNAPTAVAFHSVAAALPQTAGETIVAGIPEILLKTIALGAVLFGSMTYIGNGPNFMVKAIAEENGIKMPSFFGYILKFSLVILLPVYVLVQLIFFFF